MEKLRRLTFDLLSIIVLSSLNCNSKPSPLIHVFRAVDRF
uniref:Uncharacterized protein n=1 Tax=Arundo donax TaxID=35708 RepID=A0A0A9E2Z3_ARUDO